MFKKSIKSFGALASATVLAAGLVVSQPAMAQDPFLGQISMFGGNFAPRGWAFCEGQLLAISSYSALFTILGTTYGGDGRTTFALPDLRGRVAIGKGNGPGLGSYGLGQRGGAETVTLNSSQMPSHNHTATTTVAVEIKGTNTAGNSTTPGGNTQASKGRTNIYSTNAPDVAMHAGSAAATATTTVGNNGGSQAHENRMPYLAVNYIIALQGTFPSRN